MVYQGTVKDGRIELDNGAQIPDGTSVRVELLLSKEEWRRELEDVAEEVSRKWKSPLSAVEFLSEMRR
jgi:hypothetical protein